MTLNAVNLPNYNLVTEVNKHNTVKKDNDKIIKTDPKYDKFTSISKSNSEQKVSY